MQNAQTNLSRIGVYPPGIGHNHSQQWLAMYTDKIDSHVGLQGLGKNRDEAIADLKSKTENIKMRNNLEPVFRATAHYGKDGKNGEVRVGDKAQVQLDKVLVTFSVEPDIDAKEEGLFVVDMYVHKNKTEKQKEGLVAQFLVDSLAGVDTLEVDYINIIANDMIKEYLAGKGESADGASTTTSTAGIGNIRAVAKAKPKSENGSKSKKVSIYESAEALDNAIVVNKRSVTGSNEDKHLTQYVKIKGKFKFAGNIDTKERLPAGIYKFDSYENELVPVSVATDELLMFEDSRYNAVMEEVNDFWGMKASYSNLGFLHKRGVILYGQPGSGKSGILKLLMSEAVKKDCVVVVSSGPSGVTGCLHQVREIESERNILVILEDVDGYAYDEHALIELFDGERTVDGVMYMATTNYLDRLPPRVLRTGRFDTKVEIFNPPSEGRRAYFLHKKPDLDETTLANIVSQTEDYSFSDLRELVVRMFIYGDSLAEACATIKGNAMISKHRAIRESVKKEAASSLGWYVVTVKKPTTSVDGPHPNRGAAQEFLAQMSLSAEQKRSDFTVSHGRSNRNDDAFTYVPPRANESTDKEVKIVTTMNTVNPVHMYDKPEAAIAGISNFVSPDKTAILMSDGDKFVICSKQDEKCLADRGFKSIEAVLVVTESKPAVTNSTVNESESEIKMTQADLNTIIHECEKISKQKLNGNFAIPEYEDWKRISDLIQGEVEISGKGDEVIELNGQIVSFYSNLDVKPMGYVNVNMLAKVLDDAGLTETKK